MTVSGAQQRHSATHTHTHTHPFSPREVERFYDDLQELLEQTPKKRHPFHHSSVGEESACNAGDPGLSPGSGRSSGEGIGYPLLYPWAFLVAQLVKNTPAMRETWIQSLGWEDTLEKGKVTYSNILAWRIPWTSVHGVAKSWTRPRNFQFHFHHREPECKSRKSRDIWSNRQVWPWSTK